MCTSMPAPLVIQRFPSSDMDRARKFGMKTITTAQDFLVTSRSTSEATSAPSPAPTRKRFDYARHTLGHIELPRTPHLSTPASDVVDQTPYPIDKPLLDAPNPAQPHSSPMNLDDDEELKRAIDLS